MPWNSKDRDGNKHKSRRPKNGQYNAGPWPPVDPSTYSSSMHDNMCFPIPSGHHYSKQKVNKCILSCQWAVTPRPTRCQTAKRKVTLRFPLGYVQLQDCTVSRLLADWWHGFTRSGRSLSLLSLSGQRGDVWRGSFAIDSELWRTCRMKTVLDPPMKGLSPRTLATSCWEERWSSKLPRSG